MEYLFDWIAREEEDVLADSHDEPQDGPDGVFARAGRVSPSASADDLKNDVSDDDLYVPPPKQVTIAPPSQPAPTTKMKGVFTSFWRAITCVALQSTTEEEELQPVRSFDIDFDEIRQLSWLGVGAHGCVFLGLYRGKTVAVKKFKEQEMTQKEVKHLQLLDHENIIKFIGVCIKPPVFALVMEAGTESLYDLLHKDGKAVPPRLVLLYATHVCKGMQYLHEKNIVHRDLKSPNILRSGDFLKISDFGTCKEFRGRSTNMSFIGTVAWMAPEVIRNERCSEKVDVWSFGVVLWELLTCEIPYNGVDAGAIVWGVGSNSLRLPVPKTAPDGFSLLLQQCWNATSKHRPAFRQILIHLEILSDDPQFGVLTEEVYLEVQRSWRREVAENFESLKQEAEETRTVSTEHSQEHSQEQFSHIDGIRLYYERNLEECRLQRQQLDEMARELRRKEEELQRKEEHLKLASSPKKRIIKENIQARAKVMEDFFVRKRKESEQSLADLTEDSGFVRPNADNVSLEMQSHSRTPSDLSFLNETQPRVAERSIDAAIDQSRMTEGLSDLPPMGSMYGFTEI